MKGYFLDLFAGHGGVSRALRKAGFSARSFELLDGPDSDLTRPLVQSRLRSESKRGVILGAMLGPPCTTFSIARDRTAVIRDAEFPWGRPDVSEKDAEKLRVGNACMRAALKLIRFFHKHRIPWIMEHPASSKAWRLPEVKAILVMTNVQFTTCDFCAYGTPWRKRTSFMSGHVDVQDLARVSKMCSGRGKCSFTGRPHVQLTGGSAQGIPMTLLAQPYPAKLCHQLAYVLSAGHRV